jgi:hypothetical protein
VNFRSNAPPQPPQVLGKTLKYKDTQEHLLRRLGAAMVMQWDALPDALQDLIIDQAAIVDDREDAPHDVGDIENFIRGAKIVALAKSAPEAEGK